ncbi:alcohol dehydrogenase [Dendryphion nanum]|uniref:Alcohol dehydrogenase n=1 Tax=Dendryphion nanum TaxID=256645 RepID=A0A9P9EJ85_9PLEO|nr:alcohol dehydrogenase [Dendryphion nanum]
MRALILSGDPRHLTLDPHHPPPPSPSPTHYQIRVHAAALCRDELTWPELLANKVPVPGYDVAGVVISTPSAPNPDGGPYKFAPGDEIYAFTGGTGNGNAREITEIAEQDMGVKPKNVGWEEAASIPLSALSAWQALFVHGELAGPGSNSEVESANAGKRVLVTAASGGVGIWGVQLACHAGLDVTGTCGTGNGEWVKRLGADTVLDYTKTDLVGWVDGDREGRAFDVVLDCVGGKTLTDAWKTVRPGGKMVSVAEPADPKKPSEGVAEGVESVWFIVSENSEQLGEITRLVEQGKCRGLVDSTFALEDWKEAFEKLQTGHAKGKVVFKI